MNFETQSAPSLHGGSSYQLIILVSFNDPRKIVVCCDPSLCVAGMSASALFGSVASAPWLKTKRRHPQRRAAGIGPPVSQRSPTQRHDTVPLATHSGSWRLTQAFAYALIAYWLIVCYAIKRRKTENQHARESAHGPGAPVRIVRAARVRAKHWGSAGRDDSARGCARTQRAHAACTHTRSVPT